MTSEISSSINQLVNLKQSSIHKKDLRNLPESLFQMTSFERINLSANPFNTPFEKYWKSQEAAGLRSQSQRITRAF